MVSPDWIVIDEGKKKKPPSPTVTVWVVAFVIFGQSAKSSPTARAAPPQWNRALFVALPITQLNKSLMLTRETILGISPAIPTAFTVIVAPFCARGLW